MAGEVSWLELATRNVAKVNTDLDQVSLKAQQTTRDIERAEVGLGSLLLRTGRRLARFAGREALAFASTEVLNDVMTEDEADRVTGFVTRLGTAAVAGGIAGAPGGPVSAAAGAAVNIAFSLIGELKAEARRDRARIEAIEKERAREAKERAKEVEEFREAIRELEADAARKRQELERKTQEATQARILDFSRYLAAAAAGG